MDKKRVAHVDPRNKPGGFYMAIKHILNQAPYNETLKQLYGDPTHADFTLISSDKKEFKVHQNSLVETSDYFDKMFQSDMKEKELKSVVFKDINSETLEKTLMFIYLNKTEISHYKFAIDLLYAAEKFLLDDFKLICTAELISEINLSNAMDILAAADMFNIEILEESCLRYIVG